MNGFAGMHMIEDARALGLTVRNPRTTRFITSHFRLFDVAYDSLPTVIDVDVLDANVLLPTVTKPSKHLDLGRMHAYDRGRARARANCTKSTYVEDSTISAGEAFWPTSPKMVRVTLSRSAPERSIIATHGCARALGLTMRNQSSISLGRSAIAWPTIVRIAAGLDGTGRCQCRHLKEKTNEIHPDLHDLSNGTRAG